MKNIILFLSSKFRYFALLFVILTSTYSWSSVKIGDLYYEVDDENKAATVTYQEIASYNYSELTTASIPASINYNGTEYCVTSIGDQAFRYCSGLVSVTIPNSVTSIGSAAFGKCSSLTSITIPNSITSIGESAFYSCNSLISVVWNARHCRDFSGMRTPFYSSESSINTSFQITSFVFGEEVEHIPAYLCLGMCSLTSVLIPSSVSTIGYNAFRLVANIVYAGTITGSPWGARSMNGFVDGCLVYNDEAKEQLLACSAAAKGEMIIPNSVTSIGDYAFYNCSGLTSISIPNNVIRIGDSAFENCSDLTSVTIPNSVTSIGVSAFRNCIGLTSPVYNAHVFAFMPTSYSGEYTIPEGIKSISGFAFRGCYSLTSAIIPHSVTSIGIGAFYECSSLRLITIPYSVTSIGSHAFLSCSSLTSVTIPNRVTSIGTSTFFGCSSLTSVTIPNSVTSIGNSAFRDCSSLTSITIPNSVTSIEDNAFSGCSSLTSVTIPNRVTSIGRWTFSQCSSIEHLVFGSSLDSIGDRSFRESTNIKSITCYSKQPPTIYQYGSLYNSFPENMPSSTLIYVPADYLKDYKAHEFWGQYDVRPIDAASVETDEVKVESTTNTADVVWPAVSGAYTYELVIKDKQGNVICTLIFNANGQLMSIAFNAPARDSSTEQAQTAGFSFTVTSLEEGTTYDLTITAKDANGQTLQTTTQTFTTEGVTGVDQITNNHGSADRKKSQMTNKVLRNGQLFILRGDKTYTVQGQEVR